MNQAIEGDPSSNPAVLSARRKRGRPRKEQIANRMQITPVPPGFGGGKGNQHQRIENMNDAMVGQAVSGVVEASFDAGYLLTVRIGNSNTNFRGVVFKPGHFVPVTAENDVAPHVQMIRRNEIHIHGNNRYRTSTMQNGTSLPNLHRLQTTNKTTAKKAKYAVPTALSVPPVGARGNVVPVVLQPASMSNGIHQAPNNGSPDLDDDEVHTVEPLAMLPPDARAPTRQMHAPQHQPLHPQLYVSPQVAEGSSQNGDSSSSGTSSKSGQEEVVKPVTVTEVNTPDAPTKGHQVSSQSSQMHNSEANNKSVSKEPNVIQEQPIHAVHPSFQQPIPVTQPLKNYPTGRMTELLLALQENMPDHQSPHAKHPSSNFMANNVEDSRD